MKIELHKITVRELCKGFIDDPDGGVYAYDSKLCVRPIYQREFVYNDKQQKAVIDSIIHKFPLNVMYWVLNEDGTFELLDGQQRTLSICKFVAGLYLINFDGHLAYFSNLIPQYQQAILDYELMIYICSDGTDKEKLDWFQVINIAGERLNKQEARNAIYSGSWTTAAKNKFSKSSCVAYHLGGKYMNGVAIRQDYLETVLSWISGGNIEDYMGKHQHDDNADELWQYFKIVVDWVNKTFPKYRKEMKGLPWGEIYAKYKDASLDAEELEKEVARLMMDSDVKSKSGVYLYVLDGDERHLDIRVFDGNTKREIYEKQKGICPICKKHFEIEQMEADHITPWKEGGHTVKENCQMLCRECNRRKGAR